MALSPPENKMEKAALPLDRAMRCPKTMRFCEFYFVSRSDKPADTYHDGMRFGATMDGIFDFFSSPYACMMPSAIQADYDDELVEKYIELFATENLGRRVGPRLSRFPSAHLPVYAGMREGGCAV